MTVCAAFGCSNRSSNKSANQLKREKYLGHSITFHKFPKHQEKKDQWIKALKRESWMPTEHSRLCEDHFTIGCMDRSMSHVWLHENAIPTIFPAFPSYMQQVMFSTVMMQNTEIKVEPWCVKEEPEMIYNMAPFTYKADPETVDEIDPLGLQEDNGAKEVAPFTYEANPETANESDPLGPQENSGAQKVLLSICKTDPDAANENDPLGLLEGSETRKVGSLLKQEVEFVKVEPNSEDYEDERRIKNEITIEEHNINSLSSSEEECRVSDAVSSDKKNSARKSGVCDVGSCEEPCNETHSVDRRYKCNVCGKLFSQSYSLSLHMRIHTGERPFKCDVCSTSFFRKMDLSVHMRLHTAEMPFKCTDCGKSFSDNSVLSLHLRIHTVGKPFKCNDCGKSFPNSKALLLHTRKNTVCIIRFKCSVCSKSFTTKKKLSRHERLHSGERPFKCNLCTKSFLKGYKLSGHMRIHTGEKPFKCVLCGMSFPVFRELKKHVRIHTGEELLNVTCVAIHLPK